VFALQDWYDLKGQPYMLGLLLHGQPGTGKCLGEDTPVMLADGSIKAVQDIRTGDVLMGDDSTPRRVLSLARGREEMVRILPARGGGSYTCNKSHILSLQYSSDGSIGFANGTHYVDTCDLTTGRSRRMSCSTLDEAESVSLALLDSDRTVDISVADLVSANKTIRHRLKGFRVGVEFAGAPVPLDPYMLGYWIGDGASRDARITTADPEVVQYFRTGAEALGMQLVQGERYDYGIRPMPGGVPFHSPNEFRRILTRLDILGRGKKRIPGVYLSNDRETRLRVLAGIIDSDGTYTKRLNQYSITQKNSALADDILFLCRSLGFVASVSQRTYTCDLPNGKQITGTYNFVYLSGSGLCDIPCLLERKRASEDRSRRTDGRRYGFEIQDVGVGDYFGFELDGNGRFLLGDFSVTHNTSTIKVRRLQTAQHCFALF